MLPTWALFIPSAKNHIAYSNPLIASHYQPMRALPTIHYIATITVYYTSPLSCDFTKALTMTQLSIIIPTLNEADNIDRLLQGISTAMAQESLSHLGHEVIVVDDQSHDQTVAKARAWSNRLPIKVIERQGPADLSSAVLNGVTAATG